MSTILDVVIIPRLIKAKMEYIHIYISIQFPCTMVDASYCWELGMEEDRS